MEPTLLDRRSIALLAAAHLITDINQGAIPALLPFLVVERNLSYAAASTLVLAATLVSSILQPFLGFYADRRAMPWLMPVGMFVAGLGLALAGTAPEYGLTLACVLLSGVGVAAFHPEAFRFANYTSRQQRATGTSFFSVGGNTGFAVAPLIATSVILAFGLPGTLLMFLAPAAMSLVLWRELPRLETFRPRQHSGRWIAKKSRAQWGAFARLSTLIAVRAGLYFGLSTFLPLYLLRVRQVPVAEANGALSVLAVGSVLGTLLGGYLADRAGRRRVLAASLVLLIPSLLLFLNTTGLATIALIFFLGLFNSIGFITAVVLGQEYAPDHLGVATGLTTGMAIGIGGLSTPLFGSLADSLGLTTMFYILTLLPATATLLALTLPAPLKPAPATQPAPSGGE